MLLTYAAVLYSELRSWLHLALDPCRDALYELLAHTWHRNIASCQGNPLYHVCSWCEKLKRVAIIVEII